MIGKGKEDYIKGDEGDVEVEKDEEDKEVDEGETQNDTFYEYFIYKLVEDNKDLYDIEKYKSEPYVSISNIDLSVIDKYLEENQACSKNFMEYIKFLYSNTIRIDSQQIIDQINFNVNEILTNEKYSSMTHVLCIPFSNNNRIDKSCFYYILYFINLYKTISGVNPYIYNVQNEDNLAYKDYIYEQRIANNVLFIFCDDILYSGTQVGVDIISTNIVKSKDIIEKMNEEELKLEKNNHVYIYLNVIGFTKYSVNTLRQKIYNSNIKIGSMPINYNVDYPIYVIFPSNLKYYDRPIRSITLDFIAQKGITLENFYIDYGLYNIKSKKIESDLKNILTDDFLPTNLIYPFYKYPDGVSLYINLCKIFVYGETDKIIDARKYVNDNNFKFRLTRATDILNIDYGYDHIYQLEAALNKTYEINESLIVPTYLIACTKIDDTKLKYGINPVITSILHDEVMGKYNSYSCEKLSKPFYKTLTYKYNDTPIEYNRMLPHTFDTLYEKFRYVYE